MIALAFAAALVALPLSFAPATVAHAVTWTPDSPPPLSGLPSVVYGSAPVSGGTAYQQYVAAQMYRIGTNPTLAAALQAAAAGTATPGQLVLVQNHKGTYTLPATKPATLAKVAGGALSAFSSFGLGVMIGNGVLDLVGTAMGEDFDEGVCRAEAGQWLSMFLGTDCSGFETPDPEYIANSDVSAGLSSAASCEPAAPSKCVALKSELYNVVSGGTSYIGVMLETTGYATGTAIAVTFWTTKPSGPSTPTVHWSWITQVPDTFGANALCQNSARTSTERCMTFSVSGTGPYHISSIQNPNGTTLGSAQPVVSTSANPARTLRCVVLGSDGITYTASTGTYYEADGVIPAPVCPDLPDGVTVESVEIWEDGPSSVLVWSETVTPEYADAQTLAPECMDGSCFLDLRQEPSTVSCFEAVEACANWYSDPDKDTNYSCHYGTHVVDLAECSVYAPTFTDLARATGNWYADQNGNTIGAPDGAPNPGTDTSTFGQGAQDPAASRQCFPTGWGLLNPVEWVFRPVACALEWAFVPRASFMSSQQSAVEAAAGGSIIASGAALAASFAGMFDVSAGCQGPPFSVDWDFGGGEGFAETYYPLSACESPMDIFAGTVKVLSTVGIFVGASLAVVRYFASIFGMVGYGSMAPPKEERSGVHFK